MKFFFYAASLVAASSALLAGGCGKKDGADNVSVALTSTTAGTSESATITAADPELMICIKSIKVEQESEDDSTEAEFPIGLVNASQPEVNWGNISLPKGFKISKIKIKVHKSKVLCKTDYSIKYDSATTPQDVEFRWRFSPAIEATEDLKELQLSFREVLDHLAAAAAAGSISSLKERVEEVESVTN